MLLGFEGRRTGQEVEVVVGRHELGDALVVPSGSRWRLNFRGGASVGVTIKGRHRTGSAELPEDPDEVIRVYGELSTGQAAETRGVWALQ